jgi:hypothetical protein
VYLAYRHAKSGFKLPGSGKTSIYSQVYIMAKDCCWNCKYYLVKGDNEPAILISAASNICVYGEDEDDKRSWIEKACPTPPGYVCRHYKERFY